MLRFGYLCTGFPWELQVPSLKQRSFFGRSQLAQARDFLSGQMHGAERGSAERVRKQMHLTEIFSSGVGCSELTVRSPWH